MTPQWSSEHPLWDEFHDIVGHAVLNVVAYWRADGDNGRVVKHAHKEFAQAAEEIVNMFANQRNNEGIKR